MTIIPFTAYTGAKLCRAKNDARYYLNAFHIDIEGFIVSTDGHRLFCASVQTNQAENTLVDIKGREPSKFSYVEISTESRSAAFYGKNRELLATLPVEVVDGRFPDWKRLVNVVPTEVSCIGFTMKYLSDAYKIAKAYKKEIAKFEFQGTSLGCKISFSTSDFMLIMPARVS